MITASMVVIVVNWKRKEDTVRCLRSLEQSETNHRVIVVDNGSDDGSVAYIAGRCPQAEIIVLPRNFGFGSACNWAISHALQDKGCDLVFLLNNDAVVNGETLPALVAAAREREGAGILGPKVYFMDRPRTLWYGGARRRPLVLAPADTGRGEADRGQRDGRLQVDYVFGAAMLIRRNVLERVGLFDEHFFLYMEDLDLCLRAQKAGYELAFVPEALVWHKGSASTAGNNGLRSYHLARSTTRFLRKHARPVHSLHLLAYWSLMLLRRIASDLRKGKACSLGSHWRGMLAGLGLEPLRRRDGGRGWSGQVADEGERGYLPG